MYYLIMYIALYRHAFWVTCITSQAHRDLITARLLDAAAVVDIGVL